MLLDLQLNVKKICIPLTKCDLQEYLKDGWHIVSTSSEDTQEVTSGRLTCPCYTGTYTLEKE